MNKVKVQKEGVSDVLIDITVFRREGDNDPITMFRDVPFKATKAIVESYQSEYILRNIQRYVIHLSYANGTFKHRIFAQFYFDGSEFTHTIYI